MNVHVWCYKATENRGVMPPLFRNLPHFHPAPPPLIKSDIVTELHVLLWWASMQQDNLTSVIDATTDTKVYDLVDYRRIRIIRPWAMHLRNPAEVGDGLILRSLL